MLIKVFENYVSNWSSLLPFNHSFKISNGNFEEIKVIKVEYNGNLIELIQGRRRTTLIWNNKYQMLELLPEAYEK